MPRNCLRISLLSVFVLSGFLAPRTANAITVAAAKALPLGSAVTLNNVVISTTIDLINAGTGSSFNVQDATGGVTAFGLNADIAAALTGLSAGDEINLSGTTGSFNGLFQIQQPSLSTSLVNAGVGVPAPTSTTTADYQDLSATAENLENELVSLSSVHFSGIVPGQTFAGATNYTVTDGTNNVTVRVQTPGISLIGDPIPTGQVNITGILEEFDTANPLPGVAGKGYQLLFLDDSSITAVPEPSISILAAIACAAFASCRRHVH
jgi:hypothetical protein